MFERATYSSKRRRGAHASQPSPGAAAPVPLPAFRGPARSGGGSPGRLWGPILSLSRNPQKVDFEAARDGAGFLNHAGSQAALTIPLTKPEMSFFGPSLGFRDEGKFRAPGLGFEDVRAYPRPLGHAITRCLMAVLCSHKTQRKKRTLLPLQPL